MGDWALRPYEAGDEACVASMWLKSHARSREVFESGLLHAKEDGHEDQIRYWRLHQPIVTALIRHATIVVACDPERSTYAPGAPAVIWAWACASPGTIHYVGVKRNVAKAGLAEDIVRDLLGSALEETARTTFELVDLAKLGMIPDAWKRDRGWLSSLRSISTRALARDDLYSRVALHVVDEQRERWEVAA